MKTNNVSKLTALALGASSLLYSGCASMPTALKVVATPIAIVRDAGDLILSPIAYGTQEAGDYLDFDGHIKKIRAEQEVLEKEIQKNKREQEKLDEEFNRSQRRLGNMVGVDTPYAQSTKSSSSYESTTRPSYPSYLNSGPQSRGANGAELFSGIFKLISGVVGGADYVVSRSLCGSLKGESPWKESGAEWGSFLFPNTRELWGKKEDE